MRLLLLSRISSLVLATSFVLNLLAVLELRDVQQEERRIQAIGQRALTEVSLIRAELLAAGIVLEDKPGGLTEWRRS